MRVPVISAVLLVAALMPATAHSEDAIGIGEPAVVDATGSPITGHINVNQKFYIASEIANDGPGNIPFVYIVKVTDGDGATVLLEWFRGEADSGQTLSIAVSWAPATPSTYTVQVFLWDDIHTQNALDSTKFLAIPVS
jgi:hypothetical protein